MCAANKIRERVLSELIHAAALALVFALAGCVLPFAPTVSMDPNAPTPGWKCPKEGLNPIGVVALPPCSWFDLEVFSDSCRQQATYSVYRQKGCVPDSTTVPTWYVIVPPTDDQMRLNPNAPLTQWKPFAYYVSADQCKAALASDKRTAEVSGARRFDITQPVDTSLQGFSAAALPYAQCIAKDDPRFTGK
jgi:hypothetical protein